VSEGSSKELSAIVLGYRAGESLLRVLEPLEAQLRDSGLNYELVVVANHWPGDDDSTPEVAQRFAADHPAVKAVLGEKHGAMGWDMRAGFAQADAEVMVVIDGDSQNPVDDVLRAYELLRASNADIVKGRRVNRLDSLYRRLVSLAYNLAFRIVFPRTRGLWDINGKPKAITRAAYGRLSLDSNDWFLDAEIVLDALSKNLTIVELPVTFYPNDERASFVRPGAILEFAKNMLRYRLRRR
jgi:glycosyltransferase involved in cell wall biosynthesis